MGGLGPRKKSDALFLYSSANNVVGRLVVPKFYLYPSIEGFSDRIKQNTDVVKTKN